MVVQYDPKSKPFLGKPTGLLRRGVVYSTRERIIHRFGMFLLVFLVASSLYINQGVSRSLSQPMIRRPADSLEHVIEEEKNNHIFEKIHGGEPFEESIKNDSTSHNRINTQIPRVASSPKEDDVDLTDTVEVADYTEKKIALASFENENRIHQTIGTENPDARHQTTGTENPDARNFEESKQSGATEHIKALEIFEDNRSPQEDALNPAIWPQIEEMTPDSIKDNEKARTGEKKPRLFLHVGPQKTGSSTFQSMLDKLSELTGELMGDNIYIRHILAAEGDFDCEIDQWGAYLNCRASESLKALIEKAKKNGKDLLLTDENLGITFVPALRDVINDEDWDVTVIVIYRRIHEWLVSWYNQINKTTNKGADGNVLFNEKGDPYRTEHLLWPDQGGSYVPNFSSWYENFTQYWKPAEIAKKHRSIEFYNLYSESFDNVLLYNLHQEEGDMVTNMICKVIGANHACGKIRSNEIKLRRNNGSINLDLDILSVFAYDQGYIAKTLARKEVVNAVAKYMKQSSKVLPRKCNSEVIDQIRNWLVDTEKVVVGDQKWSNAAKDDLLQVYESYVAKGKMCDLDKDAILQDEDWMNFFKSIGKEKRRKIVLHVGPIGAKTIHNTLTTLSGDGNALQKDNYTLVDIDKNNHFDCGADGCKASPTLKSLFLSVDGVEKNLIIADDNLDERFVEAFKEAIDETKWDLKVVVGYIRLDQLLLMVYNHEYNYDDLDPDSIHLFGPNDSVKRENHSRWPDEGGITIPSFNKWFHAIAKDSTIEQIKKMNMHMRNAYVSSFDNVDFYAYHQRDDLVINFLCNVVPGATHSCKALKVVDAEKANTQALAYNYPESDILAVRARELGLLNKKFTRQAVRDAIGRKLQYRQKVLSRICVSGVTKQLYDWTIESEKAIVGDWFTSKRIAWINHDFKHFMESGKLCAFDVEKEIEDITWVNFFKNSFA